MSYFELESLLVFSFSGTYHMEDTGVAVFNNPGLDESKFGSVLCCA